MVKLLKVALEKNRYDLAAYALVLGLVKAKQNDRQKRKQKQKTGILRQGAG